MTPNVTAENLPFRAFKESNAVFIFNATVTLHVFTKKSLIILHFLHRAAKVISLAERTYLHKDDNMSGWRLQIRWRQLLNLCRRVLSVGICSH